jgi:hypothetical protein
MQQQTLDKLGITAAQGKEIALERRWVARAKLRQWTGRTPSHVNDLLDDLKLGALTDIRASMAEAARERQRAEQERVNAERVRCGLPPWPYNRK